MSATVQPLIEYLQQLQRNGQSHVHLDETARKVMREFFLVAKGYKKQGSSTDAQDSIAATETTSATVTNTASPRTQSASPRRPEQVQPTPAAQTIEISGNSPAEKIASLTSQAQHWSAAKSLGTLRDKLVFSGGNPAADIMFIADAPGYNEELKGYPFAGPSGEKLDGILRAMGLTREQVYLTYLVKFRPSMPNQTTANRPASEDEILVFSSFIDAEINVVQPKVIISLGTAVSQHLLDSTAQVDQLRETFHTIPRFPAPVRVAFPPSYLLQHEALADKRKVWEDMLAVMQLLNMPISEKQQSYFKQK